MDQSTTLDGCCSPFVAETAALWLLQLLHGCYSCYLAAAAAIWLLRLQYGYTVRRFDEFDGSTVRRFDGSTVRRVRRFDGSTVRRFDDVRRRSTTFDGFCVIFGCYSCYIAATAAIRLLRLLYSYCSCYIVQQYSYSYSCIPACSDIPVAAAVFWQLQLYWLCFCSYSCVCSIPAATALSLQYSWRARWREIDGDLPRKLPAFRRAHGGGE